MPGPFTALVEETAARGTTPGTGLKFPPLSGKPEPSPDFKDVPRDEFRGQSSRLGNVTVLRQSSAWAHALEGALYPIDIMGTLFKHALGFAGVRAVVDTTGYKGIVYPPEAFHYGPGGNLEGKAVGVIPNTDIDGVIKSQVFGGGRIKGFKLESKRPDDVKVTFDVIGGPWIGAPGQTATAGASFTSLKPFNSADLICYSGTGITRTGVGPDFTDIAPGDMVPFVPDSLTLTWDSNIGDEDVSDGLRGPAKTEVKGQAKATLEFTMDFSDPLTGFSSYDEWAALHSGPRQANFLFKWTGPDLAGSLTELHKLLADLPAMNMIGSPPERDNSGKTPKMKFKYESLFDPTCKYPIALMIVDKASAY